MTAFSLLDRDTADFLKPCRLRLVRGSPGPCRTYRTGRTGGQIFSTHAPVPAPPNCWHLWPSSMSSTNGSREPCAPATACAGRVNRRVRCVVAHAVGLKYALAFLVKLRELVDDVIHFCTKPASLFRGVPTRMQDCSKRAGVANPPCAKSLGGFCLSAYALLPPYHFQGAMTLRAKSATPDYCSLRSGHTLICPPTQQRHLSEQGAR